MELWSQWTQLLEFSLNFFTTHFGLSQALAIITLTLIARAVMMPISLTAAYKMQLNKEAIERIKPELAALRTTYKDNATELASRTMALYRNNGIRFIDKISLLNMGSQGVFGIGAYQVLSRVVFNSKFLWIASLAKPDLYLTVLVSALMLLGMALMPGATADTQMMIMLAVPIILSVIFVAALPSALGIYWATSNAATLIQTLALRGLLARNRRVAS